jgi:hypothetical protein
MLSYCAKFRNAECHFSECHFAECMHTEYCPHSLFMLGFIKQSVIILNTVLQCHCVVALSNAECHYNVSF